MKVLVTGPTGFVGRHLLPLLLDRGDAVRGLVRPATDDSWLRERNVEVVPGDLLDPESVRRAAAGCERVYHLAGVVAHERRDAERCRAVNVEGVRTVLSALEPGARLVHVSSLGAVGPARGPGDVAREDQPFPHGVEKKLPYVAAKRAGERLVLDAAGAGTDAVIANPGFLLGPDDPHRVSTWPVQRYLQGTLRITVSGGLSVADTRDVASGLVTLGDRGRTGERYILTGADGNLTWSAFFHRVGELTGVRRTMVRLPPRVAVAAATLVPWPVRPGEVRLATRWWFAAPDNAVRELGFEPRPVDETLRDTAVQYA
ncbi:MAG: NAD-dependent epimerase/dehydratase family protein [Gaiellaceae bacterium]